ncbi:hypothetical protein GLV81_11190 [Phnomibacter ginsenosidimutans]|uniref:Carboxypeptidase-like regulatory domain-containing protein n=1 Tax=Phnomibacter ginsenosidimutans TaxID=2676868 RepID=A0A6I6GLQ5_9BACT|nr:hypothetical protein GLV81_11190 [Phnomibacter ginsenosidimutans]
MSEKGTRNATMADGDGSFKISVAQNAKLVISATGFQTVEVAASAAASIQLSPAESNLSEVVVTSAGCKKGEKGVGLFCSGSKG